MDVYNADAPAWVGEHDPNYPDTMEDSQQYEANAMNKGNGKGKGKGKKARESENTPKAKEREKEHTRESMGRSQALVDGVVDMGTQV